MSELLIGTHNFTPSTGDSFKAALFLSSATINAATTLYSSVTGSEVSGAGYSGGGIAVPNANAPAPSNTSATAGTAYWTPSGSLVYPSVTLTTPFNCVLIYNNSKSTKTVSVHTFGDQTITAGTFTLTMPVNNTATALLRLATT
jgi:hypothetical protein